MSANTGPDIDRDLRLGFVLASVNGLGLCPFCGVIHDVIESCEEEANGQ